MPLGLNSNYDVHVLTSYDGRKYTFPDGERVFKSYGNYGMPDVSYQTRKGYKQDGETVVDYTIGTRSIPIQLYWSGACKRSTYWANRAALLDFLRPNRGGALTLEVRQSGGNRRALKVYPAPGPTFAPTSPDTNNWEIDEGLSFIAYDPIWYNPAQASTTVSGTAASSLIFPITFPITFSPDGTTYTSTITYAGTWKTYPVITLTGPYTSATIQNTSTNITVRMLTAVGIGQSRILTFTPGSQSIVDGSGVNKFSELSDDSNIVDFNIRPSPEVSGGTNTIVVTLTGGVVGTSAVTIAYYTRYIGI